MPEQKDVVVIGGGISGLAIAYRLHRRGGDVRLLEARPEAGGSIRTRRVDDFLVDCGPNSTLETSRAIHDFVDEIGLGDSRIYANERARKRYILRRARLQELPMTPRQFMTSGLFSARAKARLCLEPFIKPAPPEREESVAQFVERRLGREFLDYAINPFIAGVYAGDPARLSVRSAVAKVYALEGKYGSLIKGAIKGARARKQSGETEKTKANLFSFDQGMAELPAAIGRKLGSAVSTGCAVESVSQLPGEAGLRVCYTKDGQSRTVDATAVVLAVPAFVAWQLLDDLAPALTSVLGEIEYPPVAMVFLGFRKPVKCRALDGFGFLVPEVERRKILGTIWSSTLFAGRAPAQGAALTTFVGGARQPKLAILEDDELADVVRGELQEIMGLESEPDLVHVQHWQHAIPQYTLGHARRIEAIERVENEHPGLYISGNFRGGISVGDCIVNSETTAARIWNHVTSGRAVDCGV